MKIALVSEIFINGDINSNFKTIANAVEQNDADMILFGEASLHGFDALRFYYKDDIYEALSQNSEVIARIRACAKSNGKAIGFGYYENYKGAIYSSYMVIGKNGEILLNYRRVSKGWRFPDTCSDYREGSNFMSFNFESKRFGIMLCGDFWEDELLCQIISMDEDVDMIIWPVHTEYNKSEWNKKAEEEYAKRTEILESTVLYIDNCHKDLNASRAYVFHQGKTLAKALSDKPTALVYDLR